MPALRYRAKPMTKGFTTEGGMRCAFPPYGLDKLSEASGQGSVKVRQRQALIPSGNQSVAPASRRCRRRLKPAATKIEF